MKEETPSDSEMKRMDSWAAAHIAADARSLIMNTPQKYVAIHADLFEEAFDDDDILGPLCTKDGIYCEWAKEGPYTRLRCFKGGKRFTPRKNQRPTLVAMHDEAIVRHKDIGRHGWGCRNLASQVYKDDGCGRMLSDYFLCMFGHLLLNEKETEAVNRIRADRGDPPTRFGTTSPTEASGVKLGAWEDEEVAKELVLLNAEREAAGEVPILPSWSTSTCKLDYGKNRDQCWRCPHIKLHLEQHYDMFEFKCPEHEPIVVKVPIPSSLLSFRRLFLRANPRADCLSYPLAYRTRTIHLAMGHLQTTLFFPSACL